MKVTYEFDPNEIPQLVEAAIAAFLKYTSGIPEVLEAVQKCIVKMEDLTS